MWYVSSTCSVYFTRYRSKVKGLLTKPTRITRDVQTWNTKVYIYKTRLSRGTELYKFLNFATKTNVQVHKLVEQPINISAQLECAITETSSGVLSHGTGLVTPSMVAHQSTAETLGMLQSKVQGSVPQSCTRDPLLNFSNEGSSLCANCSWSTLMMSSFFSCSMTHLLPSSTIFFV